MELKVGQRYYRGYTARMLKYIGEENGKIVFEAGFPNIKIPLTIIHKKKSFSPIGMIERVDQPYIHSSLTS